MAERNTQACSHLKISPHQEKASDQELQGEKKNSGRRELRIDRLNKLMGIKRHPEFEKDYQALMDARRQRDEEKITEMHVRILKRWGEEVERIENADEIYEKRSIYDVQDVTAIESDPIRILHSYDNDTPIEEKVLGKDLYLKVNIDAPLKKLIQDFKEVVSRFKHISRLQGRNRVFEVNPWQVWDMKEKEGKNFCEITREIFGLEGNPNYDDWRPQYNAVQRAYKHAEKILTSIKTRI